MQVTHALILCMCRRHMSDACILSMQAHTAHKYCQVWHASRLGKLRGWREFEACVTPSLGCRAIAASDAAAVQAVTSGANPIAVKKGIDKACEFLIKKLRENSKPVKGTEDIRVSSALK